MKIHEKSPVTFMPEMNFDYEENQMKKLSHDHSFFTFEY